MPKSRRKRARSPRAVSTLRLDERAAGVLLHPTSLPGPHGSGALGPAARTFIDFLAAADVRWWQMLPIGPPGPGFAPYSARSAFAGSPLLISLDDLRENGLLERRDLAPPRGVAAERVNYEAVSRFRSDALRRAFETFLADGGTHDPDYRNFAREQAAWLEDYALFAALRRDQGRRDWIRWSEPLRLARAPALAPARDRLATEIEFERFAQFIFYRQWTKLRRYAHERGIGLIGDVPYFVAHDSADVWSQRPLFDLDRTGRPKTISGVPPDQFSKTGQLWGHPQYRWSRHKRDGFAWWLARFRHTFDLFDAVRIDHFLGFHRVWTVAGGARTAAGGRWVKTPGDALFDAVRRRLGRLEIIAEDLGVVTPQATALREKHGWPGMRLLHFAFGSDDEHYHEPHAHERNAVAYPGTHDNDTTVGWFQTLRREARRTRPRKQPTPYDRLLRYTGANGARIHWDVIRLTLMSVANTAVLPMQDLLGLGSNARMNHPGKAKNNWRWRMRRDALRPALAVQLRELLTAYGRVPSDRGTS